MTGAEGIIGKAIRQQIPEYSYTCFDLPENDARDYQKLSTAMKGSDVAIHLAWNTQTENWLSDTIDPDNIAMTLNVYRAAQETKTRRVIMASSIHANDLREWRGPRLLSPSDTPSPDSLYGANKVFMEALGRLYAKKELEVVCIRFMGINSRDKPAEPSEKDSLAREKWFSYRDCGNLIRSIVAASAVPDNFAIVYGVSNNTGRPADVVNPFGWMPQDNSSSV